MACIEITDDDFDDMHHALGRPSLQVLKDGAHYRNFYSVSVDSITAERFMRTGLWALARTINGGRDGVYTVTADGRSFLADWLTLRGPPNASLGPGSPPN